MKKTCKKCDKPRYANLSLCYRHYRERERMKKEEKAKRKLERKVSTKKFQESLRKKLYKTAWKKVSEWVRKSARLPDSELAECYTCGKVEHWKKMHCGHRYHGRLDFDVRNLKCQCFQCNHPLSGNLGSYERHLIEEYGMEWCKKLELDANTHQGYSVEEIKEVIKEYTI